MLKRSINFTLAALTLCLGQVWAAEPVTVPAQPQVYGSQLMTQRERTEHRFKMRTAATPEQRAQIREESHVQMRERAEQQGLSMPEHPPVPGGGLRMGLGAGRNR